MFFEIVFKVFHIPPKELYAFLFLLVVMDAPRALSRAGEARAPSTWGIAQPWSFISYRVGLAFRAFDVNWLAQMSLCPILL